MSALSNHNVIESAGGYQMTKSLRFRAAATAYLSRTFGTPTNNKIWTFSTWVKRGQLGTDQRLLASYDGSSVSSAYIVFNANDTVSINTAGTSQLTTTTAVYRDPSSWYHIVVSVDMTAAKQLIYINGIQVGSFAVTNVASQINGAYIHRIGSANSGIQFLDGYLADCYFIDGQALAPTSFGQTDTATGQWTAKKYTGTYGTNGFYLPFTNTSTTATLCADASGNGNNWTPNNISLTAGVTYDSMNDVPALNGGYSGTQPAGNYCVMNPLDNGGNTLSSGNLNVTSPALTAPLVRGTIGVSSGKWYWEFVTTVVGTTSVGVSLQNNPASSSVGLDAYSWGYLNDARKYYNNVATAYGSAYIANDTVGIALDMDAGTITFYKNGVSQGQAFSGISGIVFPAVSDYSTATSSWSFNFGQRPFTYTPPTGYKALCTANLTNTAVTITGSFTGNVSADGPSIWTNGTPETLTINGNAVTFGTHADKLAYGFKLRTTSTLYNSTGTNTWTATVLSPASKSAFKNQNAKTNP